MRLVDIPKIDKLSTSEKYRANEMTYSLRLLPEAEILEVIKIGILSKVGG